MHFHKRFMKEGERVERRNSSKILSDGYKCACGATYETGSTKEKINVEICSNCHPFFTGKQKLVDTGGRVDRFKKRFGISD